MLGLKEEGIIFIQSILTGMIVYSGYACIRKIRRIIPHKLVIISIEDMVFWAIATIYIFVQFYYTSDGSIRWYQILGIVFGGTFLFLFQNRIEKIAKKD